MVIEQSAVSLFLAIEKASLFADWYQQKTSTISDSVVCCQVESLPQNEFFLLQLRAQLIPFSILIL